MDLLSLSLQQMWSVVTSVKTRKINNNNNNNNNNSRNLIKAINTWALLIVRYPRPFLKWTREKKNKQMNQRTRKIMTLHKTLHSRDEVHRLYVSRKKKRRRLASIEDSVDASIKWLEDYIQRHGGRLIIATRNNTDKTRTNRTTINRKQKSEEKQLYGRFKRLLNNISHERTWIWIRKENLKR